MAILSADELSDWWMHTVTVKSHLGASAYGDRFGDPVPVPCFVEDDVKLIRDSDGNEVVSSTTVYSNIDKAALFPVGSLVITPFGREARVIGLARHAVGDPDIDHVEIHLS